ncbi:MAG: hypothetical protein J5858_10545 [Lentisphaeria bacterium]|nr:hypothetical protein [Lentisphaeria bacterium]
MRGFASVCLIAGGILSCCVSSGCRSSREPDPPQGKFMQNDSSRTPEKSKGYFAREQEKKRRYDREFKTVDRPMNQDHFKVMPWQGKHYQPRSEGLHDSSREENSSLFKF